MVVSSLVPQIGERVAIITKSTVWIRGMRRPQLVILIWQDLVSCQIIVNLLGRVINPPGLEAAAPPAMPVQGDRQGHHQRLSCCLLHTLQLWLWLIGAVCVMIVIRFDSVFTR